MIRILFFLMVLFPLISSAKISDSLYQELPDSLRPVSKSQLKMRELTKILSYFRQNRQEVPKQIGQLCTWNAGRYALMTNKVDQLKFLHELSVYWFNNSNETLDSAHKYSEIFLRVIGQKTKGFELETANVYQMRSTIKAHAKDFNGAVEESNKALALNKALGDKERLAKAYGRVGYIYNSIEQHDRTIAYADSAITLVNDGLHSKKAFGQSGYFWLIKGDSYISKFVGNPSEQFADSAYTSLGVLVKNAVFDKRSRLAAYSLLSKLFYYKKDYSASIAYADTAFSKESKEKIKESLWDCRTAYKALSLVKTGEYDRGIKLLKTIPQNNNDFFMAEVYQDLYRHEKRQGNYASALDYYEKWTEVKNNYQTLLYRGEVFEATQKYNVTLSNLKINKLHNDQQKTRYLTIGILLMIGFAALFFGYLYKSKKKRVDVLDKQIDDLTDIHLVRIQEAEQRAVNLERKKLGQELHDNLATSIATSARYLRLKSEDETDVKSQYQMRQISDLLENCYNMVRGMAHEVYLEDAIDRYWERLTDFIELSFSGTDIDVHINYEASELNLSPKLKTTVLLILKEAITNVIKHADANTVEILIYKDPQGMILEVNDDGHKLRNRELKKNMGLKSIQQRLLELGGVLDLSNTSSEGTKLKATIPILKF